MTRQNNPTSARTDRALISYIQAELSAPAIAIAGYAEILLDEVRKSGAATFLDDLERIHLASRTLSDLISSLIDPIRSRPPQEGADADAYRRQLRHDLRTPINVIKGYGEMLREDAADGGASALVTDLDRLLGEASRLLEGIDRLVIFSLLENQRPGANTSQVSEGAVPAGMIEGLLKSVRPISENEADGAALLPSRILVVDDNPSNRDLLRRRLERQGHSVILAENGTTALSLVDSESFDLILLDLLMPDISGFEVLLSLKADARFQDIPVIMISALDEIDSIVRCIEAGAEDYLTKPFDPILLRARIGSSLEKKHLRDKEREASEALRIEKERSERLLLNILPAPIVTRLKEGETVIADHLANVTILFADFVGFTQLSSRLSAPDLVGILSQVFAEFDKLALRFGVEKIKTIGDAYMAACGLFGGREDHAHAVADMALAMIETVSLMNEKLPARLEIRVGVNSGDVVAGVIGAHKFIYDIWGDAVNVASRLESHGLPCRIQISHSTYESLREDYVVEPRGNLEIRGRGFMQTYFLIRRA
ncbi:adenylate/guanylate cyclase domain-containing protein [Methylocystis sp. 9N]|uniref:histidine kinase n=1 Tax=Methylocystis borbori TaxID=3118750 RepID=A0ABU7XD07_9HYPH